MSLKSLQALISSFNKIMRTFMYQKKSKDWFKSREIELLDWSAISPDMNPMWGIIARDVYHNLGFFLGLIFEVKSYASLSILCLTVFSNLFLIKASKHHTKI